MDLNFPYRKTNYNEKILTSSLHFLPPSISKSSGKGSDNATIGKTG